MGIASWFGGEEKDLERGEELGGGDQDGGGGGGGDGDGGGDEGA